MTTLDTRTVAPAGTDITDALQVALNSTAREVRVPAGIWTLSERHAFRFRGSVQACCVTIPSDTALVLEYGAELHLATGSNCHMIANTGLVDGCADQNIDIVGGLFHMNRTGQDLDHGHQSAIKLHNVECASVIDVAFVEVCHYAIRATGITDGTFRDLHVAGSFGSGFSFGLHESASSDGSPMMMRNCMFDQLSASDCEGLHPHARGNPVVFTGRNCSFGAVHVSHCNAGFKVQDGSARVTVESVIISGDLTINEGMKVQGSDEYPVTGVSIGSIVVNVLGSLALYAHNVRRLSVGSIIATHVGGSGWPVIRVSRAQDVTLSSVTVDSPADTALVVREDSSSVHVGNLTVRNESPSAPATAPLVIVRGSEAIIGSAIIHNAADGARSGIEIHPMARNAYVATALITGPYTRGAFICDSPAPSGVGVLL